MDQFTPARGLAQPDEVSLFLMKNQTVMTVSRALPQDLQRRILRCAVTAVRDAGATNVATSITEGELVVEAVVPD